jgi:hypothetical protein
VFRQTLINATLRIGKRGQKTELPRRSPLRRRRSEWDCSAVEEEGGGEEEEEVGGGGGEEEEVGGGG